MSITYDAHPTESSNGYRDADPTESVRADHELQTTASAWSSSPLGQLDDDIRDEGADGAGEQRSIARHAILVGALACGIGAGAALGLMFFDAAPSQPIVVVPGVGTSPHHSVVVTPTDQSPSPKPVISEQETVPVTIVPAPAHRSTAADPGTPPVGAPRVGTHGDTTVVVDIPIPDFPPLPEKPGESDPQPPAPEDPDPEPPKPPVIEDPNFKQPEPPKPEPDPDPPVFLPDLPLAPLPQPDPIIETPLAPTPILNPQPEPPSLPNFIPPVGFGS
jgi:hypothetical protein